MGMLNYLRAKVKKNTSDLNDIANQISELENSGVDAEARATIGDLSGIPYNTKTDVATILALNKVYVNIRDFGAVGDGETDDTEAIQDAIDYAYSVGGGGVFCPIGKYKITSLILYKNVRLLGTSYLANAVYDVPIETVRRGTWFYCMDTANPAIVMQSCTSIEGISFFYPSQETNAAPIPYPATIKTTESHVKFLIRNCMLQNSYIGIEGTTSHENLTIENVHGFPLSKGIYIDNGSDIDRISNVNFSYNCWYEAGETLKAWVASNGIAFDIRKSDWGYLTGSNAYGYNVGINLQGNSGFNLSVDGFDGCVRPIVMNSCWSVKLNQITVVQYNPYDLAVAQNAITLSTVDGLILSDIFIGPTYGNAITMNNCKNVNMNNILISEFGRETPSNPAKFGIYLIGGNSYIRVKDCTINGKNHTNTWGVLVDGTNDHIIIKDNIIVGCDGTAINLGVGSTNVICKDNQVPFAVTDSLGEVTKDIKDNMIG